MAEVPSIIIVRQQQIHYGSVILDPILQAVGFQKSIIDRIGHRLYRTAELGPIFMVLLQVGTHCVRQTAADRLPCIAIYPVKGVAQMDITHQITGVSVYVAA